MTGVQSLISKDENLLSNIKKMRQERAPARTMQEWLPEEKLHGRPAGVLWHNFHFENSVEFVCFCLVVCTAVQFFFNCCTVVKFLFTCAFLQEHEMRRNMETTTNGWRFEFRSTEIGFSWLGTQQNGGRTFMRTLYRTTIIQHEQKKCTKRTCIRSNNVTKRYARLSGATPEFSRHNATVSTDCTLSLSDY